MNALAAGMRCREVQTRWGSLVEASTKVVVGYLVALATQQIVFPHFGIDTTLAQDSIIAAVFTVVSLLRSYALRRLFERFGDRSEVRRTNGAGNRLAEPI